MPAGAFGTRYGGATKTDAAGRFVLEGLVAGHEYHIVLPMHEEDDPDADRLWRDAGTFTAEGATTTDVGDFRYKSPHRPPALEGR